MHANITFTVDDENEENLSFPNVLVIRNTDCSVRRRVYHQSTWSGQYMHFNSIAPVKYKHELVKTLFDQARRISSDDHLNEDCEIVTTVLLDNGCTLSFIGKYCKPQPPAKRCATVEIKRVHIQRSRFFCIHEPKTRNGH